MRPHRAALATALAALLAAPWALAQGWTPPPAEDAPEAGPAPVPKPLPGEATPEQGVDLIERGAGILFRDLMDRVAPQLDQMRRDMGDAMSALGPAVGDLARLVDDMQNYEPPERLANGDIILRRKPGAPPPPPVGEGLKRLTEPKETPPGETTPVVPVDPYLPQTEL